MASLSGKTVLITGASAGIGAAIAEALAKEGSNLILLARSQDNLTSVAKKIQELAPGVSVHSIPIDAQYYEAVKTAVDSAVLVMGQIDILINNAGLALGAPSRFHELTIEQIQQMSNTNINGTMFTTHAVLNSGMAARKQGTILNVSSTTALEAPPFPGEAVYHASKAFLEGFSNSLRNEYTNTNLRIMTLRPGAVASTNFHIQRVGHDQSQYDEFFEGWEGEALRAGDVAEQVVWMLRAPERISVKALDVVSTAQRSIMVWDREWDERNGERK
ncbi:hypothetical protein YB2330_004032 [Saitoella coloradoensis]